LTIRPSPELYQCRDTVCSRFHLLPRADLHVTLLWIGRIQRAELTRFVELMRGLKHILPHKILLDPIGVTAAGRTTNPCNPDDDSYVEAFGDDSFERFSQCGRSAWLILRTTPLLDRIRNRALEVGRQFQAKRCVEWVPHITLGVTDDDPVYDVLRLWSAMNPTEAIDIQIPTQLEVGRLHFTNGQTQPRSLANVWRCR
jgi:2'-5' RNA ligase